MSRALLVILLTFGVNAQAGDLFLMGGTVHSVSSPPETTSIRVQNGVIVEISPTLTPGADDEVIDATGLVVTPGFVEFNTQIGLVEVWAVDSSRDGDAGGDEIRAGFRAVDALNPQSVVIPVTRIEGVTSVVSHPSGGLIAGQSVWWDLAGDRVSEMVVLSSATMDMNGGAAGGGATGGSRASALLRYRELFADLRSFLDDPGGFQAGRMRDLSVSLVDLQALERVLDGELPVMFRAERQSDILVALELAREMGLRLIVAGGAEAWAVADDLAAQGVPIVIDPLYNAPYSLERIGSREDGAAILDRAGVEVIISTGSVHRAGVLRQSAGNAVRAGMDYASAMEAVTIRPARAVGVDDRYGTLEVGKVANIVVWSGDPFELSTRVRAVVIRGESIPLTSRQTRLFERYRDLDRAAP
jgi:imidazolonepropionase-like amidohydrolase